MGQIKVTSKMCTVGVPPGTGFGNTALMYIACSWKAVCSIL